MAGFFISLAATDPVIKKRKSRPVRSDGSCSRKLPAWRCSCELENIESEKFQFV
jgi:hypothetical protein